MEFQKGLAVIEAILFVIGEPITASKLSAASGIEPSTVEKLINQLNDSYRERGSALQILKLDESFQLATKEEYAIYIKSALETRRETPLSQAALETLAVVAYNEPVTKAFVEQVRGVDSSAVVNSLVDKGLLEEAGRLDLPGRPVAFRTTEHFLRAFGISSLEALPDIPELSEQINFDDLTDNSADEV